LSAKISICEASISRYIAKKLIIKDKTMVGMKNLKAFQLNSGGYKIGGKRSFKRGNG
jgi:hypothetical protein